MFCVVSDPVPKPPLIFIAIVLATAACVGCTGRERPLVAFLGDSLTQGWGLSTEASYPALLARDLAAHGYPIRALNAGRGGDTVAQGLARLAVVLRRCPDVLVVALGVNDALRGMNVDEAEADLRHIMADARAQGARVVLVGVHAPPSLATVHTRRFASMYARLAANEQVAFVPDLLAHTAGDSTRMFPDALHPNAAGQRQLAENVRPALELTLAQIAATGRAEAGDCTGVGR